MASATHSVLSTPELLEAILLDLDMQTLLVSAQRVCKAWGVHIKTSSPLQRALFFEPIHAKSSKEITTTRTRNPLLASIFEPFFPPKTGYSQVPYYFMDEVERPRCKLAFSFINKRPPTTEPQSAPGSSQLSYTGPQSIQPLRQAAAERRAAKQNAAVEAAERSRRRRAAFLRRGASWRRMLVQQPAAPSIGVIENRGRTEQSYFKGVVPAPAADGGVVRMGLLYDLVYQHFGLRAIFSVYWRVPAEDPEVTGYPGHGAGNVVLRQMADDVGIVVQLSAAGMDPRDAVAVRSIGDLKSRNYMPDEFEVRKVDLTFVFGQDWFG